MLHCIIFVPFYCYCWTKPVSYHSLPANNHFWRVSSRNMVFLSKYPKKSFLVIFLLSALARQFLTVFIYKIYLQYISDLQLSLLFWPAFLLEWTDIDSFSGFSQFSFQNSSSILSIFSTTSWIDFITLWISKNWRLSSTHEKKIQLFPLEGWRFQDKQQDT